MTNKINKIPKKTKIFRKKKILIFVHKLFKITNKTKIAIVLATTHKSFRNKTHKLKENSN